jgi:hypothetical protein
LLFNRWDILIVIENLTLRRWGMRWIACGWFLPSLLLVEIVTVIGRVPG